MRRPASSTWRGWARCWRASSGRIRHAPLDHLSPFSVPILLEIGKRAVAGPDAARLILAEAEEDLIAEAMQ